MRKITFIILIVFPSIIFSQSNWETLNGGFNQGVYDLLVDTNRNLLYASGQFAWASDTVRVNAISYWDGLNWYTMDSGQTIQVEFFNTTKMA